MNFGDSPKNVPADFCSASISYEREHHSPTSKARQNVPNHLKPTPNRLNPDTFMVHVQNLWGIPNTSAQTFISPKPRSPISCAFKTYERGAKLMTASIGTGLESGLESGARVRGPVEGPVATDTNSPELRDTESSRPLRISYVPLMCTSARPGRSLVGGKACSGATPSCFRPSLCTAHVQTDRLPPAGCRVPPLRPAATINRTMHNKLDHFIVHPRETHPLSDVLKNTKKDTNRPFLHTPAPSSF